MNIHQQVMKIMFPDGFHIVENHGVWKLKKNLSSKDWNKVRRYFKYYHKGDMHLKNTKYWGWMTTDPVGVLLTLRESDQTEQTTLEQHL